MIYCLDAVRHVWCSVVRCARGIAAPGEGDAWSLTFMPCGNAALSRDAEPPDVMLCAASGVSVRLLLLGWLSGPAALTACGGRRVLALLLELRCVRLGRHGWGVTERCMCRVRAKPVCHVRLRFAALAAKPDLALKLPILQRRFVILLLRVPKSCNADKHMLPERVR